MGWRFPSRALLAVLVVASLLTSACSRGDASSATGASRVGTAVSRAVPSRVADLSLLDDGGRPVRLADLRGKVVVLTDLLTLCQEICPLISVNLQSVQRDLARAGLTGRVVLVEATVDPRRDTPARLAAYRRIVGAGPEWKLLTGSAADMAALWNFFGIAYEQRPAAVPPVRDWWTGKALTYDVAHNDALFFLDRSGKERYVIAGPPNSSGLTVPAPLNSFLSGDGRANLASPAGDAWTVADVDSVLSQLTGHRVG